MNKDFIENIKRIAVYIRFDIENEHNLSMVNEVINALFEIITNNEMCEHISKIRPDINLIRSEECGKNIGTVSDFLLTSFTIVNDNLTHKKYSEAYDIADMIQGLPDYDYLKNKSNMNSYYNNYVKPIITKYNYTKLNNIKDEI